MIRKKDLLIAIDELTIQVIKQGELIRSLEKKLKPVKTKAASRSSNKKKK